MTTTGFNIYEAVWLEKYIDSLPLWRKILARFFEKYRITKKEYDTWFYKNADKLLGIKR